MFLNDCRAAARALGSARAPYVEDPAELARLTEAAQGLDVPRA